MVVEKEYVKMMEDPRSIDESEGIKTPMEIATYQAWLTNKRLDALFSKHDEIVIEAWSNVNIPNLQGYFAVLKAMYNWGEFLFSQKQNQRIGNLIDAYWEKFFGLLSKEQQNLQTCYEILFILDQITHHILGYFQLKGYFFLLREKETRGIEAALEQLERKAALQQVIKQEIVEPVAEPEPVADEEIEEENEEIQTVEEAPEREAQHQTIRDFRELQSYAQKTIKPAPKI
jgi:hypothetical protein